SSGFGEWGVDECLDSLGRQGTEKCIVIGIDSGPGRMSEYNPYDYKATKGNANAYIDFIVNSLKPYVDKNLRTMVHKKHTFIAGSSMGGLVSFYAVMKYPDVFGGAGIFSPSFWIAPAIINDLDKAGKKMHSKLFFYAGATESTTMLSDMQNVESKLKSLSHSSLLEQVDANAKHNEAAWRKYFPVFYKWIMRK
ncbi:MAG: alpha/beta hydrolase-fold protein, partial [Ferruginibacter sp.]